MSESVNALLPLFRSEHQARLLAALFVPERPSCTIGELAAMTGVPQATVSREVTRLVRFGVLAEAHQGRNRFVQANWSSPWARDLQAILAKTVGVPALVSDALSGIAGIKHVWIFGSWAARYHGEPGPPPQDLDVLVVGEVDTLAVRSACRSLEPVVGVQVDAVILTVEEWNGDSGLAVTVRDRPLVEVHVEEGNEAA